ncbi:hypothetical protein L2X99_12470 [Microbacterium sp. KUDC0406]|uniref:hypothetical protein n=1 Tax=Microbacterium sp. KUDC0406 TaxID=2909588 RepID=UPI001F1AF72E|nr:hypothetical protein [Microbacterium sp. KUDC0406]UJP09248.1 hypothetical protein L2X99_12470 [Microbacterium sp. KUDC0406]
MASPNSSAAPRRRITANAGTIALFIGGVLFDVFATINVPGTFDLPATSGGETKVTDFGGIMTVVVIAAWVTVFWRRRGPLLALLAGAVLALIGVSYVLLLIGAVCCIRRRPAWMWRIAIGVGALVLLFVVREALTPWAVRCRGCSPPALKRSTSRHGSRHPSSGP